MSSKPFVFFKKKNYLNKLVFIFLKTVSPVSYYIDLYIFSNIVIILNKRQQRKLVLHRQQNTSYNTHSY